MRRLPIVPISVPVRLDVSSNGRSYLAQVESSVLSFVRERSGTRVVADSCLVVKSGSRVKRPT